MTPEALELFETIKGILKYNINNIETKIEVEDAEMKRACAEYAMEENYEAIGKRVKEAEYKKAFRKGQLAMIEIIMHQLTGFEE